MKAEPGRFADSSMADAPLHDADVPRDSSPVSYDRKTSHSAEEVGTHRPSATTLPAGKGENRMTNESSIDSPRRDSAPSPRRAARAAREKAESERSAAQAEQPTARPEDSAVQDHSAPARHGSATHHAPNPGDSAKVDDAQSVAAAKAAAEAAKVAEATEAAEKLRLEAAAGARADALDAAQRARTQSAQRARTEAIEAQRAAAERVRQTLRANAAPLRDRSRAARSAVSPDSSLETTSGSLNGGESRRSAANPAARRSQPRRASDAPFDQNADQHQSRYVVEPQTPQRAAPVAPAPIESQPTAAEQAPVEAPAKVTPPDAKATVAPAPKAVPAQKVVPAPKAADAPAKATSPAPKAEPVAKPATEAPTKATPPAPKAAPAPTAPVDAPAKATPPAPEPKAAAEAPAKATPPVPKAEPAPQAAAVAPTKATEAAPKATEAPKSTEAAPAKATPPAAKAAPASKPAAKPAAKAQAKPTQAAPQEAPAVKTAAEAPAKVTPQAPKTATTTAKTPPPAATPAMPSTPPVPQKPQSTPATEPEVAPEGGPDLTQDHVDAELAYVGAGSGDSQDSAGFTVPAATELQIDYAPHVNWEPTGDQSQGRENLFLMTSGIDRKARKERLRRRNWIISVVVLAFCAVIFGVVLFLGGIVERLNPSDFEGPGGTTVSFEVKPGQGPAAIANELVDKKIVASDKLFLESIQLVDAPSREIHPGTYELREEMPALDAATILIGEAAAKVSYVAIKENTRMGTVITDVATATGLSETELGVLVEDPSAFGLPKSVADLEGYLHPGEYRFPVDADAKTVLKTMVDTTLKTLTDAGITDPEQQYHVLKVASILQAEARPNDYATVAGALENRLREGNTETAGLLQVDSSVIYGLDRYTLHFTPKEKADAGNAYNTYVHPGLPPTPIGSPGSGAITAAAHPEANDFYYWVTVNANTGETKFAKTYAEHRVNQNEFRTWCAANTDVCK